MRTTTVRLPGKTPLLMHNDNIEWADRMTAWQANPKNRGKSKAGDDRTPPFRWVGSLYLDGPRVVMPSDNVMSALMGGGALVKTGKGQKTFKAQTMSGLLAPDPWWELTNNGTPVRIDDILDTMESLSWEAHNATVARLGFMLYLKRARVGNSKHIRVRPRFDQWAVTGKLIVTDEELTPNVLQSIGDNAGQYQGLGDWRASSPRRPGPWGLFGFEML